MPAANVALLDVNETLSDLQPLRARLDEIGAGGDLLDLWFASTLRDGFALTAAGAYKDFHTVARGALVERLARVETLDREPGEAADHVLACFAELDVHPDVHDGVRKLAGAGVQLAALTNGDAKSAAGLLERAALAGLFERVLGVDVVRRWKPAAEPYLHAARELGARPHECVLIAVHPWDIDGAKRAGLQAAWLNRAGVDFPGVFEQPDATGAELGALADALIAA